MRHRDCASMRWNRASTPGTALGRDANAFVRFLSEIRFSRCSLLSSSTGAPQSKPRACITKALVNNRATPASTTTTQGHPMLGSRLVRDPKFTARVVAETRALLAPVPR